MDIFLYFFAFILYICKIFKIEMILYKKYSLLLVFLVSVLFSACSPTKFVPDDKYLLDKVDFVTETKSVNESELKTFLRQEPNFKVFGLTKLYLGIYNLSGRDSTKWRNRQLRNIGEPPVIYDPYLTLKSEQELLKYMQSKGYRDAEVKAWPEFKNNKKAKVTYYIKENKPYKIKNIKVDFSVDSNIDSIYESYGKRETLLKEGMLFDIDVLDEERVRIDKILKRRGYFYFNKDYITYMADTSLGDHQVELTMILKPYIQAMPDGSEREAHHKKYSIRDINIITLSNSSQSYNPKAKFDTIKYKENFNVLFNRKPFIRPKVLYDEIRIFPHLPYNVFLVDRTYSRLNSLGIVRSTNIQFEDTQNDNKLDCSIVVTPAKAQSFSIDLEGTNSWGDLGFAINGEYQHKNLFHGSELFKLKGRYAYEAYSGLSDIFNKHVMDVEFSASLNFPRFLFPFASRSFRRRVNAHTEFDATYNFQTRPNTYDKQSYVMAMKYLWNMRRYYQYSFNVLDLTYININTYPNFDSLYSAPRYSILRESYSDHFILSSGVSFQYDDQTNMARRDKMFLRLAVESAGNLLYGFSKLTNSEKNENGYYEIGNLQYSQYIKGEFDFAKNKYVDRKNRFVYHLGFGIAYPYGNGTIVPFEKRFFGGGASGVRGWSVRTLGPGSYYSENKDDFVKQTGDLKLEANIEYRTKLFWKIEMGAFVDAGNIWTLRLYDSQPKGQFRFDTFYNEIALAYGAGLRFDFTFFLLRFDMGVKAYDPSRTMPDCWRFEKLNWSDDFAFHFAIGYPF